jgi:putative heme-binding domain-containing protein
MFPQRFHGAMFVCDWALGEIRTVELERSGASYTAKSSMFLRGRPLNVTDLAVGPDGMLYFTTGGRGTEGGIYRIAWTGKVPAAFANLGEGIEAALRQPQFDADWSRARLSGLKRQLGEVWNSELPRVMRDPRRPIQDRLQAVDLLTFFGPPPSSSDLIELTHDPNPPLRAKSVRLMSVRGYEGFSDRLVELLSDDDALVRRLACEAIARRNQITPVDPLVKLLADRDRFVAFAARRALEKTSVDRWKDTVLASPDQRVFVQGAVALMSIDPTEENALAILQRATKELPTALSAMAKSIKSPRDGELLDLLRVMQLALIRGNIKPEAVPELSEALIALYPTKETRANRELVKLLAYLQPPEAPAKLVAELTRSDLPDVEKLQIAAYAARIHNGWGTAEKIAMLRYFEESRQLDGGHSLSAYIEKFARDFFTNLSLDERRQILALGERFPTSVLSILANIPPEPGPEVLAEVRALDGRLSDKKGDTFDRTRVGIVAVLGATKEPESHAYLRELFHTQPERRGPIAMSLTQNPEGDNWDILVESLATIEPAPGRAVMATLTKINRRPETAEPFRDVILQAQRLRDSGGEAAIRLLEHWAGENSAGRLASLDAQIASWQDWYTERFPDSPPAVLPKETEQDKWAYDELLSFLESDASQSGDSAKGSIIFREALCSSCHRFNNYGEAMGPDLTTVSRRFHRREILESVLFPSHDISDQYASTVVVANGGVYVGVVSEEKDAVVILTAAGEKIRIDREDVEEMRKSDTSSMPAGLLNPLSLKDIADLFAYLMESEPTHTARGAKTGSALRSSR